MKKILKNVHMHNFIGGRCCADSMSVLGIFLNFGRFQPHVLVKEVLIKSVRVRVCVFVSAVGSVGQISHSHPWVEY